MAHLKLPEKDLLVYGYGGRNLPPAKRAVVRTDQKSKRVTLDFTRGGRTKSLPAQRISLPAACWRKLSRMIAMACDEAEGLTQ